MTGSVPAQILAAWAKALPGWLPVMAVGIVACVVLVRYRERLARAWPLVIGVALAAGLGWVWSQRALTDDAAITLRYADHVLRGLGPVWNVGQRVEGITNFGWMLLEVALGATGMRLEHAALLLSLCGYLLLVGATLLVERTLDPEAPPLASSLVAVQVVVTAFGTTGLESDAASALVLLGGACLLRARRPRDALLAGLAFATAGLFHLDHLLAGAVGGGGLLLRHRRLGREDRASLLAFAGGLLPYVYVHAWKVRYYGVWLPNTFWAKSGDRWYPSQGLVYELLQAMSSNHWLLLPAVVIWPWVARGRERAFAAWALVFSALWHLYILKVGGDFMAGRFLIPQIPLVLLAAVRVTLWAAARWPVRGLAAAAALGATTHGVSLLGPMEMRWFVADENTVYPLTSVFPPVVDHHSVRQGHLFHEVFVERGLHPVVATTGIGFLGFYSDLEVVDLVGLTEPDVAFLQPTGGHRGRPGHEKNPKGDWIDARGVDLIRWQDAPREWKPLQEALFQWDGNRWFVWQYHPELMEQIHTRVPEIHVLRPGRWIRAVALKKPGTDRADALRRLRAMEHYYFATVSDPVAHDALVRRIDELWPPP